MPTGTLVEPTNRHFRSRGLGNWHVKLFASWHPNSRTNGAQFIPKEMSLFAIVDYMIILRGQNKPEYSASSCWVAFHLLSLLRVQLSKGCPREVIERGIASGAKLVEEYQQLLPPISESVVAWVGEILAETKGRPPQIVCSTSICCPRNNVPGHVGPLPFVQLVTAMKFRCISKPTLDMVLGKRPPSMLSCFELLCFTIAVDSCYDGAYIQHPKSTSRPALRSNFWPPCIKSHSLRGLTPTTSIERWKS